MNLTPLLSLVDQVSTKLKLIGIYAKKYSKVIIGGAMANTMVLANGCEIGESIYEKRMIEKSKDILSNYSENY